MFDIIRELKKREEVMLVKLCALTKEADPNPSVVMGHVIALDQVRSIRLSYERDLESKNKSDRLALMGDY